MILNKPVSAWERYKSYIIGVVLCLAETALIVFLIVQRQPEKSGRGRADQSFNVSLDLKCIANTDRLFPAIEPRLGKDTRLYPRRTHGEAVP